MAQLTLCCPLCALLRVGPGLSSPAGENKAPFQWSPHALSGLFCFSSSSRLPGKRVTARPRGVPLRQ